MRKLLEETKELTQDLVLVLRETELRQPLMNIRLVPFYDAALLKRKDIHEEKNGEKGERRRGGDWLLLPEAEPV